MSKIKVNYNNYLGHPEVVKVCMNCREAECEGICDDFKNAVRRVMGLKPVIRYAPRPVAEKVPRERKKYTYHRYQGKNDEEHTIREWAEIANIPYATLYMRMFRGGMTLEAALAKDTYRRHITVNGEKHTIPEWAGILGVNRKTIYRWVKKYDPEQAILKLMEVAK